MRLPPILRPTRPPIWRGILLVAVLALTAGRAHALSTLLFDGDLTFTQATGRLDIAGTVTALAGIAATPVLAGSQFNLHAQFASVASNGGVTTAGFDPAPVVTDLAVIAGDGLLLLTGDLQSLTSLGGDGLDLGLLTGHFTPTGGSLLPDFTNPISLFGLQLNLTSGFGTAMFDSDLAGHANGRIEAIAGAPPAIPEPATWALMALGLLGLSVLHRPRRDPAGTRSQENLS